MSPYSTANPRKRGTNDQRSVAVHWRPHHRWPDERQTWCPRPATPFWSRTASWCGCWRPSTSTVRHPVKYTCPRRRRPLAKNRQFDPSLTVFCCLFFSSLSVLLFIRRVSHEHRRRQRVRVRKRHFLRDHSSARAAIHVPHTTGQDIRHSVRKSSTGPDDLKIVFALVMRRGEAGWSGHYNCPNLRPNLRPSLFIGKPFQSDPPPNVSTSLSCVW